MKGKLNFRRLFKWMVFLLLMTLMLISGLALRNYFLRQLQTKLSSYFTYSQAKISFFPPGLTFENIVFSTENPSFTARRLRIETKIFPFFRTGPARIVIEKPVIRYHLEEKRPGEKTIFKLPSPLWFEQVRIKGAEIFLDLGSYSFQASGLRALGRRQGDVFEFKAEASSSSLILSGRQIVFSARLKMAGQATRSELKLGRFLMAEADRYLKLEGWIKNLNNPEIELNGLFWFPMKDLASWLKLPFTWQGKVSSTGQITRRTGRWLYRGEIQSPDLALNELPLGKARGWVETTPGVRGDLALEFELRGENQRLSLSWERGKIAAQFAHFYLDPVLQGLKLPWPVKSPSWGKFYLAENELIVDGELREKDFQPEGNRYPFQGSYRVSWDKGKNVIISAREFMSHFARFDLEARLELGRKLEIDIKSEVADVEATRLFLQDLLKERWNFPAIRGQAEARVKISGQPSSPEIHVSFEGSPFSFDRFEVKEASGEFRLALGQFLGHFNFRDPELAGEAEVKAGPSGVSAFLAIKNGDWSKTLRGLGLNLPLRGKFEGPFRLFFDSRGNYSVRGEFLSPGMIFLGQAIRYASGQVAYEGQAFSLKKFSGEMAGGQISGELNFDPSRNNYSVDLSGQGLFLDRLISGWKGQLAFSLKGEGVLGRDKVRGNFEVREMALSLYKKPSLKGQVELLPGRQTLEARLLSLQEAEENFEIDLLAHFNRPEYSIQGKGRDNLLALIPWKGTSGRLNYFFEIKKEKGEVKTSGVFEASGERLPFPGFPQPLTDFSLLVFLQDRNFSLRSFQGKLGGGEINGFGEIRLEQGPDFRADIQLDGHDVVLSPLDRTRFLTDFSLRLVRNEERYALDGLFSIKKAFWRRELFEKIGLPVSSGKAGWPSFFKGLTLSLRLKANDQAWLENSLARIRGRFDVTVSGEIGSPLILGEMEALDGVFYFQERTFRLLKGKVIITNPAISAPYLEIVGETYVQDYRVNFSLSGPLDRLKPEFSSSPPLASEEILALLALGESFKRITSTDVVSQVSTASFLSGELIEEARKRAQKVLNLDRLRIDPFVLGSSAEMTARLTVGKKIAENFFILYSTNLTTQREEIVRIEWELRPGLSLVGIRDELGRLSFDLKIRRRF
jgi:hypothetical protein